MTMSELAKEYSEVIKLYSEMMEKVKATGASEAVLGLLDESSVKIDQLYVKEINQIREADPNLIKKETVIRAFTEQFTRCNAILDDLSTDRLLDAETRESLCENCKDSRKTIQEFITFLQNYEGSDAEGQPMFHRYLQGLKRVDEGLTSNILRYMYDEVSPSSL